MSKAAQCSRRQNRQHRARSTGGAYIKFRAAGLSMLRRSHEDDRDLRWTAVPPVSRSEVRQLMTSHPPRRTHHRLQVLARRRLRHCTARFGSSRRNPAPRPNNVRNSAYTFPINCPYEVAAVVPEGHCPISRGDHHHQISIASTRGPRFRATRFLQRLSMAHVPSRGLCRASQKPHNCATYFWRLNRAIKWKVFPSGEWCCRMFARSMHADAQNSDGFGGG